MNMKLNFCIPKNRTETTDYTIFILNRLMFGAAFDNLENFANEKVSIDLEKKYKNMNLKLKNKTKRNANPFTS